MTSLLAMLITYPPPQAPRPPQAPPIPVNWKSPAPSGGAVSLPSVPSPPAAGAGVAGVRYEWRCVKINGRKHCYQVEVRE